MSETPNETQEKVAAGQPATNDKDAGQPAQRGGKKATDTGGAKSATSQLAEVEGVMKTDPTNAGRNPAVPTAGVGDDAVLLHADEELSESLFDDADSAQYVTLNKDIVEEFVYPGTKRPAHRILYTKGQVVARSAIEALNVAVKNSVARADGKVDEANPAGIDETTLASGTYPGLPASK